MKIIKYIYCLWREYDKYGNCIYYKDNKGNEIKNPFNVEGTSNSYDKV